MQSSRAPSNNRPVSVPLVLQRKSRPAATAPGRVVQQQRNFLHNRVIQRALSPVDVAKEAAAHLGERYDGNDADADFNTWYQERGYWDSLPQQAYNGVAEEFFYPVKIRSLDLQLVQLSLTLQGIQPKALPALTDQTKGRLESLVDNYDIKIPREIGDIMPNLGIRPDQKKYYLKIKTALVALGRFVADLHTGDDIPQLEAALLKKKGFIDNLLQALSGRLCHNDCAKGLRSTLQPIPGGLKM